MKRASSCLCLVLLLPGIAIAEDWPHWRGPSRNGVTSESSGYPNTPWDLAKPAWRVNVGKGSSSPLVVGGRIYTMGWKAGKDVVVCLDSASGKEIWSQSYACPLHGRKALGDQGQYSGPSSTPEFDAASAYLYTLSTDGDLNCWDTKKAGQRVWSINLHEKYKVTQRPRVALSGHRDYGFTTSPLVSGDLLLIEVGAAEGTIIAFDKRTGKEAWRSELAEPAGHTGGLAPMTVEGIPCLAVLTHFHLAVVRLDKGNEGKTLAKYPWVTEFANHMTICKLKITPKGAEKMWETKYPSGVCSPVIHKGRIYLAWRTIRCLDFDTGKQLWSGENLGTPGSCIVTADDRLIVWGKSGDLYLAETAVRSPDELKILAQKNGVLRDTAWPHVVLANGGLYCKDREGNLVAFRK
jgi:outer membrane protein assembly factor BamB